MKYILDEIYEEVKELPQQLYDGMVTLLSLLLAVVIFLLIVITTPIWLIPYSMYKEHKKRKDNSK